VSWSLLWKGPVWLQCQLKVNNQKYVHDVARHNIKFMLVWDSKFAFGQYTLHKMQCL
jgi:hypothetical protein